MVVKSILASLRKTLGFFLMLIFSISLGACSSNNTSSDISNELFSIGISQIIEHPALDSARNGFIEALKSKGYEEGKNLEIDIQFAQGDIALTSTIAQNFVSQNKDLILAISTPSAQSAHKATSEIPIIFTAVTDPVSAGLVKNLNSPEGNITGTSDMTPIKKELELGKKIFPNAKKVGVIFNTSEINSQVQVDIAKEVSKDLNLEIIEIPVTNTSEIEPSLNSKIKNIDFLFLPSDNLVASSLPIIAKIASNNNIAIIGVDEPMVKAGALACEGLDYYKLGFQTGLMAVEILEGKEIKDLPVSTLKETQLIINEDIANKLGVKIPNELLKRAKVIKEDR
ncbi:ABC transporter substrate-binding protein [Caloranaerobacter sp. DY30410]|uniref:ABC transporter substrate-binding protein n=1 Tax=Caloranaerobacter sp. DY30410 TaxID=3238305 RepID=UPI003D06C8C9